MAKRGQTSAEYLFIIVSIILFVVLVFLLLRGNLLPQTQQKASTSLKTFLNISKPYLLYDTFEDNAMRWQTQGGIWHVANAELTQQQTAPPFKIAYAGNAEWYNYAYEVQFQARSSGSSWVAGVGARLDPQSFSRYACYVDSDGNLQLLRFSSLQDYEQKEVGLIATPDSNWHTLGIVVAGNVISCFYDGVESASYTDAAPLTDGLVSMESYNVFNAFDDVKVWPQSGPVPSYNPSVTATPSPTATPTPVPAPVISDIQSVVNHTAANVTWITDVPANSQVEYGLTAGYGTLTNLDVSQVKEHRVTLTGLSSGTTYHYRVISCIDATCSYSSDHTLTTTSGGSPSTPTPTPTPLPQLTGISTTVVAWNEVCAYNVTFKWNTDIASDSLVEMGNDASYGYNTTLNATSTTVHAQFQSSVRQGAILYYRDWSCAGTACNMSENQSLILGVISGCGAGGSPLMVSLVKPPLCAEGGCISGVG